MTVNPFWFGVLMTIFAFMFIVIVMSFIGIKREERREEEHDQKEDSDAK